MKIKLVLLVVICVGSLSSCRKKEEKVEKHIHQKLTEGGYTYEFVTNDPTETRIYTLKNGLKVYMSVYEDAPRIQTYIAVKAGSKNDPSNATGLAHYLEHMMFKGTSKIGSLDWEKEKVLLDEIEALYEKYRKTTDEVERKEIYAEIDRLSGEASQYATANEYDKIVSAIGAKGTNAYTSMERTVYVNDIPSNQLNKWLEAEAERFSEITSRLFHTELEAVYEEKNRSLDNDFRKGFTEVLAQLFKKHPYGTQTTIGTIEHLKNPSITEIKKYFYKYYVPNNFAICMSGHLDPRKAIRQVDKYFGKLQASDVDTFKVPVEEPLAKNIEKEVWGSDQEMVLLGFRLPAKSHKDAAALQVLNQILYNNQAGLIDVNLNQKQKVLNANSFQWMLNDYSIQMIHATAREGQDLSEVKDLLLNQIDKIKAGKFENWMIEAAINNMKIGRMKSLASNRGRANALVESFISDRPWEDYLESFQELEKVSKHDIVTVAEKYMSNYVTVFKRNGEDKNIVKVEKPIINRVKLNRDIESDFYKTLMAKPTKNIDPVFADYSSMKNKKIMGLDFMYKLNEDNETFNLYYLLDIGKKHDKKMALAVEYLEYLGTEVYTPEEIKNEFFKLGTKYSTYTSNDKVYISMTGLQENFDESLQFIEHLIKNNKPDKLAYGKMVDGILKKRENAKLDKHTILHRGMINYAKYGAKNPFTNRLSESELKSIDPQELSDILKELLKYNHTIMYYGSGNELDVISALEKKHELPSQLKTVPKAIEFEELPIDKNMVYWVDYDMVQAEIIMLSKSVEYDPLLESKSRLYNQYFGAGMGSVVFQEMRESKALAYSVSSYYSTSSKAKKSNYVQSYIGTQSDKLPEAMSGMTELLDSIPESPLLFKNAKVAIINKIETERITKSNTFFDYLSAKEKGIDYDIRKDVYEKVKEYKFQDILDFQNQHIKNKPQAILVIGSKEQLNFGVLESYGEVKELTLEELYGY